MVLLTEREIPVAQRTSSQQTRNSADSSQGSPIKNSGIHSKYSAFIDDLLKNDHARKVPGDHIDRPVGALWYLVLVQVAQRVSS